MASRYYTPWMAQAGQNIGRALETRGVRAQKEQQNKLIQSAYMGDPQAIQSLMQVNPQLGIQVQEAVIKRKAVTDQAALSNRAAFSKETKEIMANIAKFNTFEEAQEYGDRMTQDIASRYPEIIKSVGVDAVFDEDDFNQAKTMFGDAQGDQSPAGRDFESLIADFTPEQKKEAKLVKAGLKGRAMSNALLSAIKSGDIEEMKIQAGAMKQAEKFGAMTGASRAKAIDKGFESIVKIESGIGNIDRAIAAIDKGAGVGAVEKLWPSIKAASVELDNIRGQMALDVVGATTFGALSKGELDLAKDIALPTGLDSAELKVYLTEKKAAQEKLKSYYGEQIQFLDQGGTVAGFLRMKERGEKQQPEQSNVNQQALEWANANPNDPRSAAILKKLQGNQ